MGQIHLDVQIGVGEADAVGVGIERDREGQPAVHGLEHIHQRGLIGGARLGLHAVKADIIVFVQEAQRARLRQLLDDFRPGQTLHITARRAVHEIYHERQFALVIQQPAADAGEVENLALGFDEIREDGFCVDAVEELHRISLRGHERGGGGASM